MEGSMTTSTDTHAPRERGAGADARQALLTGLPVTERRLSAAGISTAVLEGGEGRAAVAAPRTGRLRRLLAAGDSRARDLASRHRARPARPRHVELPRGRARRRSDPRLARGADRADVLRTPDHRRAAGRRRARSAVRRRPRRPARAADPGRPVRPRALPADARVRRSADGLPHAAERAHARGALGPVRLRPRGPAAATGGPVGADQGLQPRAGRRGKRRRRHPGADGRVRLGSRSGRRPGAHRDADEPDLGTARQHRPARDRRGCEHAATAGRCA